MRDLREVEKSLINLIDWMSLGLELGLFYPTLEKIDNNNLHNIDRCKRAMLAAWLAQQDDVLEKGVPSWSVLQAALRRMGENQIASEIHVAPN